MQRIFFETLEIWTLKVPLFLFIGCWFIAFLTLFLGFLLFLETEAVVRTLRNLYRKVEAIEPRNAPIDAYSLKALSDILSAEELVRFQWGELEKTLLFEGQSESVHPRVFSTRSAEVFFSPEAILSMRVNGRLYGVVPGMLTSAGLLLTFVAILFGLSEVSVDGEKITGVATLVNNLSGKFISSITALCCAIVFTVVERRRMNDCFRSLKAFAELLDSRFARKTVEQLLSDLRKDLGEQKSALRIFGTYISEAIKEALREGNTESIRGLNAALVGMSEKMETFEQVGSALADLSSSMKTLSEYLRGRTVMSASTVDGSKR